MFLLSILVAAVRSQVLGIDFGTDFFKASLISPGKSFVILENMTTKRKTENGIAFDNNERAYESDGASKKTKIPKNTFLQLNKYLGQLQTESLIEISRSFYEDFQFEETNRGTVAFKVDNVKIIEGQDTLIMSVEELVGMVLKYIVRLADFHHKVTVKQCVLTVPSEWNFAQRAALKSAAAIADLELLGMIHENSAVALYYGLDRADETPHTVLFYNIGSYNIQVSLVDYIAFNSTQTKKFVEQVKVVADYSIPNAGGATYDLVLSELFAAEFDKQPSRQGKKSIKSNVRAMNKLRKASTKYKEILSANRDAPVYIEGLIDGEDFQTHITRATFESALEPLLQKLTIPIDYVLNLANRTVSDISIVELIGGGIRVPVVQQKLQEYFGKVEVGTHLNGDESMALGAAFHAANLSHSFKVKPVHFYDGYSFNISAEFIGENYYKEFQLFSYKKKFGATRSFEFTYENNLQVVISILKDGQKLPYVTYNLNNITKATELNYSKPDISMTFKLSSNDFLKLEQAELKVTEIKLVEIPPAPKPNKTEAKTESKSETENSEESSDSKETESKESTENTETETKETDPNLVEDVKPKFKSQKIFHTFPIEVETVYQIVKPLNKTEIDTAQERFSKFETYETKQRNFSEIKNKHESFIYDLRDAQENEGYMKASTEEERAKIIALAEEHALFLEEDSAGVEAIDIYANKLKDLQDLVKPINRRLEEYKLRPQAVNESITKIQEVGRKAMQLNTTMPWISEEKKGKLFNALNTTSEWLKEKLQLQEGKQLHEDPAFLVEDLKLKMDTVNREYLKIKAIPKPRKTQEEKEKEEEEKRKRKEEAQKAKEEKEQKKEESQDQQDNQKDQEPDEDL